MVIKKYYNGRLFDADALETRYCVGDKAFTTSGDAAKYEQKLEADKYIQEKIDKAIKPVQELVDKINVYVKNNGLNVEFFNKNGKLCVSKKRDKTEDLESIFSSSDIVDIFEDLF